MQKHPPRDSARSALDEVLGYLNFSSGAPDTKFLASLDRVFRDARIAPCPGAAVVEAEGAHPLRGLLLERLDELQSEGGTFAECDQARAVIGLLFDRLLPAYAAHHRDLLHERTECDQRNAYCIGRFCEALLAQGAPWDAVERIEAGALRRLNVYIGYRPLPVLEGDEKLEPYSHEWVLPVPLYVAEAGVAAGRYEELISEALRILRETDSDLLARAHLDPDAIAELAVDPRPYDFDHPANRRPNHHFGLWDPHTIDSKGRYRRFVLHEVTLDALLARVDAAPAAERPARLYEAAAVLAGTMMMAAGICGSGPDTHSSDVTLGTLLPQIAAYRDEFYEQLLVRTPEPHATRLRTEAEQLRQPLGGARQALNHALARARAAQLQRVHLAQLYARMGYLEAATRQAEAVRVASARMLCRIYCRLSSGHQAVDARDLESAAAALRELEDLLHCGIECGALVDPWCIVGFGGNFALFPAVENSIHDFRVDALIELMERVFALGARAWSEAAANESDLESELAATFQRLATWWDRFATSTVGGVKPLVGKELEVSTNLVAGALAAWHKAGAAAGDIGFWRMFVEQFDSPKAFQLVVEALLEKGDHIAAMALIMQWLSQSERISIESGDSSLHRLAVRWIRDVEQAARQSSADDESWPLVRKFFDFLEANADDWWQVPQLEWIDDDLDDLLPDADEDEEDDDDEEEDEDDDSQLYSAAYEEMTYRDSTDDGFESDMLDEGGDVGDFELEYEARRLGARLAFLTTLARLWKHAAIAWGTGPSCDDERRRVLAPWQARAAVNHEMLLQLLDDVQACHLPRPSGEQAAMLEYDRRRMVKEGLLERILHCTVEMADAARFLLAAAGEEASGPEGEDAPDRSLVHLLRAILTGDIARVRDVWPDCVDCLLEEPILYVPLVKGGDPRQIVAARATQQLLRDLLAWLPRLGLIHETCQLLQVAQAMEGGTPVGPGAVTEFDRLFETGHKAIVQTIVTSATAWDATERPAERGDRQLVECLQQLVELQLKRWLVHSRTLRLSVLEKVFGDPEWQELVEFIERYGATIFTQHFLHPGNVRAILHQGVETWLQQLQEDPDAEQEMPLLADNPSPAERGQRARQLKLVLEAVVENYGEYRDYNSTTTQSDRGDLLFMLLDFVRLRAEYDRVAWNLRPVVIAHEIVVRRGRAEAAEIWRRSLAQRTSEVADRFVARLNELSARYGMRLPSVGDRVRERFVQPLAIDRVRALIEPAMREATEGGGETFAVLEEEIEQLAGEPSGAGFDVPAWLATLEEEVSTLHRRHRRGAAPEEIYERLGQIRLARGEMQAQLDAMTEEEEEAEEGGE